MKSRKIAEQLFEWIIITVIAAIILIPGIVFINQCIVGNKQIVDFTRNFNAAYVKGDSNIWTRVEIKAWKDYSNSDSVQIVMPNGKAIYTHLSNVKLVQE